MQYVSEDGISSGIHSSFPFEKARNENVAGSSIESALKKLGGTEFLCTDVKIQGPIPFIAAKEINELRRTAIETLRTNRETSYIFERKDFHATDNVYPQTKLDFTANVLNKKARDFYSRHGAEITEGAAESGTALDGKTLMTTKHCLKHSFGMCKKPGRLFLFDKYGRQFDLHFDCGKCEMKITESKRKSNL